MTTTRPPLSSFFRAFRALCTFRGQIAGALIALATTTQPTLAAPPQWYSNLYTTNSNSQITLKDSGNNNITAINNPTAAQVKTNANTNTQPPTIIIQATGPTYWKDPVATYANLPTTGNQTGDTRKVSNIGKDFTWNGSAWVAVAIDQSGNLTTTGRITTGEYLQINGANVVEGAACTGTGLTAKDANGLLLTCISSVWRKQDYCVAYSGNLNSLQESGCYNGSGLTNAPTGDWFFVEVMRHYNTSNYYTIQRATGMTGTAANNTWTRSQQSGTSGIGWSAWKQLGGSTGGYTFLINGYGSPKFYGVGNYNSSAGTFSGDLMCDPETVYAGCGSYGRSWCGSSGSCAWNFAYYFSYGYSYTVGVSALPINTVTTKW